MPTLTEKILAAHLTDGEMKPGNEIGLRIDQTLTQDSTGTMAYLELEAMGIDRVKTERSVAYIDHNMLQSGPENFDDHLFIQSAAENFGITYSRPGNGICHQVHLENFGIPGKTLIGSDSHTPTGGGLGMIAIGAGGVDVAAAMAGRSYYITCRQAPHRRFCEGHHSLCAAAGNRQGRRQQSLRIHRRRRENFERSRTRHDHEHGRRARRHLLDLP